MRLTATERPAITKTPPWPSWAKMTIVNCRQNS